MSLRDRKKVAIFACGVAGEYQTVLVERLAGKAAEAGYYSLCFSHFNSYAGNMGYEYGERNIVQLPYLEDYDGIFLCLDTYEEIEAANQILELVREKATCPVVSIRREAGNYNCVLIEDTDSMRSVTEHLLDKHGFKDFFYVSGPKSHPDAIKRLKCFKKVLAEHDMDIDEDNIFYGNFWKNQGNEIVDAILERRGKLPDVVVCANDYSAMSVVNALNDRGYSVPEDVAVTGFDDIVEAQMCIPSLTSVRMDVYDMACAAWTMMQSLLEGRETPKTGYVSTCVVSRESCGCDCHSRYSIKKSARSYYDQVQKLKQDSMNSVFMSVEAETAINMELLNKVVFKYLHNNDFFRDYVMVFNTFDWAEADEQMLRGYTENVKLNTYICTEDQEVTDYSLVFNRRDILPDGFYHDQPCAYYAVPLHYQELSFGYAMISYLSGGSITEFLQYMIIAVCNAYENMRVEYKMGRLIDRLSGMYVTDAMSNLKNRYGFDTESRRMYDLVMQESHSMAIIVIDMDGLKTINDTFGHAEGDFALKLISDTIKKACFSEEQCFRMGGDEFEILALDYSENSVDKFFRRFKGIIDEFNASDAKPYNIQASYGYVICTPEGRKSLNEWLTAGDDRMYEMKERNRSTRKIIKNS